MKLIRLHLQTSEVEYCAKSRIIFVFADRCSHKRIPNEFDFEIQHQNGCVITEGLFYRFFSPNKNQCPFLFSVLLF